MTKREEFLLFVSRREERRARRYRRTLVRLRDKLDDLADDIDRLLQTDAERSDDHGNTRRVPE